MLAFAIKKTRIVRAPHFNLRFRFKLKQNYKITRFHSLLSWGHPAAHIIKEQLTKNSHWKEAQ